MYEFFYQNPDQLEVISAKAFSECNRCELNHVKGIRNTNELDWTIFSLSNRWFRDCVETQEKRMAASYAQLNFFMHAVGPMLSLLTDAEWQQVEANWNKYLYTIRTFNSSFLGQYVLNKKIDELTADYYNIVAWRYAIDKYFADEISKTLRSRSVLDFSTIDSENLQGNEFHNNISLKISLLRLKVTDEVLNFVISGLKICEQCPLGSNWIDYYKQHKGSINIPIFSTKDL